MIPGTTHAAASLTDTDGATVEQGTSLVPTVLKATHVLPLDVSPPDVLDRFRTHEGDTLAEAIEDGDWYTVGRLLCTPRPS